MLTEMDLLDSCDEDLDGNSHSHLPTQTNLKEPCGENLKVQDDSKACERPTPCPSGFDRLQHTLRSWSCLALSYWRPYIRNWIYQLVHIVVAIVFIVEDEVGNFSVKGLFIKFLLQLRESVD